MSNEYRTGYKVGHYSYINLNSKALFLKYKAVEKPLDYRKAGAGMNTGKLDKIKAENIVAQLITSAVGVQYGSVSVTAKLHEGRVVEVLYSRLEHTRDLDTKKDSDN